MLKQVTWTFQVNYKLKPFHFYLILLKANQFGFHARHSTTRQCTSMSLAPNSMGVLYSTYHWIIGFFEGYKQLMFCLVVLPFHLYLRKQYILSVVDLLHWNPIWLSPFNSYIYELNLEIRILDNVVYVVYSSDVTQHLLHLVLSPFCKLEYVWLFSLIRQFFRVQNKINEFTDLRPSVYLRSATCFSSEGIWSLQGNLYFLNLQQQMKLSTSGSAVCISICLTSLTLWHSINERNNSFSYLKYFDNLQAVHHSHPSLSYFHIYSPIKFIYSSVQVSDILVHSVFC
jgi:hypothetical protein